MAIQRGPKIVTSGLVLALDAANKNSYPGSDTVWRDLSGNNNNGTLTNGPTFNSTNGGRIVFDGTNDYVNCGSSSTLQPSSITFSIWVTRTNTWGAGSCLFWAKPNGTFDGNGFYIEPVSVNFSNSTLVVFNGWNPVPSYIQLQTDGNTTFALNTPVNFCFTLTGTTGAIYINGISKNILTNGTPAITSTSDVKYIMTNSPSYGTYTPGQVSNILLYNRALSASEVLQNYNVVKTRFGL